MGKYVAHAFLRKAARQLNKKAAVLSQDLKAISTSRAALRAHWALGL